MVNWCYSPQLSDLYTPSEAGTHVRQLQSTMPTTVPVTQMQANARICEQRTPWVFREQVCACTQGLCWLQSQLCPWPSGLH